MPRLTESRALKLPLPEKGKRITWCTEVRTFGVRCTPGARSYIVNLRLPNGSYQQKTLGAVGVIPFEAPDGTGAKDLALAAILANRRGNDPEESISRRKQPQGMTLDELWTHYLDAGCPRARGTGMKRTSTIRHDRNRYRSVVAPVLGKRPVAEIDDFADRIKTRGQRNQGIALVKSLLRYGASRGLATVQPIKVAAGPSRTCQEFLSGTEMGDLDRALDELIRAWPKRRLAFSLIRLLMHTGCRFGELAALEWTSVDLAGRVVRLPQDKASDDGRTVLLSPPAVAILRSIPRTRSFVFCSRGEAGHLMQVRDAWREAREHAGIARPLRIHDLRHTFASASIKSGQSLFITAKLLGHRSTRTAERYSHLEEETSRGALDRIAGMISGNTGEKRRAINKT